MILNESLAAGHSPPLIEHAGLAERLPVFRPLLPSAEKLLPYLRRIDESRYYSNYGPLSLELESRLTELLQLPAGGLTCTSSGTVALIGAILGAAGPARHERRLALIPSFTFIATATAVERCGYQPYLVDVDDESWMLDPDRLRDHPQLGRVGLVIPVAPFGRPVPQLGWKQFRAATGISVVIDGAASFAGLAGTGTAFLGDIPVALSFHATKAFATGEGGAVATTDVALARRVGQALNFGVDAARNCVMASTNGKMSEYHAAVGLAELDEWPQKLGALRRVAERYRTLLEAADLGARIFVAPDVAPNYSLFRCRDVDEATATIGRLQGAGIGTRLWYGRGLGRQTYYLDLARDELAVTEHIASCLLGLPVAPDLRDADIAEVIVELSGPRSVSEIVPLSAEDMRFRRQ